MSIDQLLDAPMNVKDMTTEPESSFGSNNYDFFSKYSSEQIKKMGKSIANMDYSASALLHHVDAIIAIKSLFPEFPIKENVFESTMEELIHVTSMETITPQGYDPHFENILISLASSKTLGIHTEQDYINSIEFQNLFNETVEKLIRSQDDFGLASLGLQLEIIEPGRLQAIKDSMNISQDDLNLAITEICKTYIQYTKNNEKSHFVPVDTNHFLRSLASLKIMYPDKFEIPESFEDEFRESIRKEVSSFEDFTDFELYPILLYSQIIGSEKTTIDDEGIHIATQLPDSREMQPPPPLPTTRRFGK